eukprot:Em0011g301a
MAFLLVRSILPKVLSVVVKVQFKRKRSVSPDQIWSGTKFTDLPCIPIREMTPDIIGASTGPQEGLCEILLDSASPLTTPDMCTLIAGVSNWKCPLSEADGLSFSLYDHKVGMTDERNGDPNADVYAVIARPNNAILAIADGCSWGPKPRQAARCAVRGSMEYLNQQFFDTVDKPHNTQDIVRNMLLSFHSAQKMIVENNGTTTTLCVAVVCELAESKGENGWGLCVVSVGDSPCFVWQKKTGQVFEVTSASHSGHVRDMRDSGGCLGTSMGQQPDLDNLVCCYMTVAEGDAVFLTSDGISDNFDPVTRLEGATDGARNAKKPERTQVAAAPQNDQYPASKRPILTPRQRQTMLLSNISQLLNNARLQILQQELSAWELNNAVIKYVIELTDTKRRYMEHAMKDIGNPTHSKAEKEAKELDFKVKLKSFKGKLDHATIVTYKICLLDDARHALSGTSYVNIEQSEKGTTKSPGSF